MTHLQCRCRPPLSPAAFDLSLSGPRSRREEALHFSVAGFVSSEVYAFPIVYLTAFLTEVKDMVEALIIALLSSAHPSPPLSPSLLLCVFLLQE